MSWSTTSRTPGPSQASRFASSSSYQECEKTNRILKEIEQAMQWPKERRSQSSSARRAVLHAIRDRLTVEEAAQFAPQLPMLVRGLYYEGSDPTRVPRKMSREQLLERVQQEVPYGVERLVHERGRPKGSSTLGSKPQSS